MNLTETSMRVLVIAVLACLTTRASATAADLEANKLLIRSYIEEMWNKHQPSAADRLVATDFIEHNPRLPQGLAGTKQFVTKVLAAFSNYHGELQDLVAEGDKVAAPWSGPAPTTAHTKVGRQQATSSSFRLPISFVSKTERSQSVGT